jgi:methanogenic corrinoid protein MtbC1
MCIKKELIEAINDADRRLASDHIALWVERHPGENLMKDVVLPVMDELSKIYSNQNRRQSVAQGYVMAKVAGDAMERVLLHQDIVLDKGPVILGNIEDDFHSLGRIIVKTFLIMEGWEIIDLGNDVTAEEFVDKAEEVNAPLIAASAMMQTTAKNIIKIREELKNRMLEGKIKLAVGGAVFNAIPELVSHVGGDGTCNSGIEVAGLCEQLVMEMKSEVKCYGN